MQEPALLLLLKCLINAASSASAMFVQHSLQTVRQISEPSSAAAVVIPCTQLLTPAAGTCTIRLLTACAAAGGMNNRKPVSGPHNVA